MSLLDLFNGAQFDRIEATLNLVRYNPTPTHREENRRNGHFPGSVRHRPRTAVSSAVKSAGGRAAIAASTAAIRAVIPSVNAFEEAAAAVADELGRLAPPA